MCRAAKTPSMIAQQKAATTPKLMKTMEATNWKRRRGGGDKTGASASSLFITLTCLYLSSPNMQHLLFLFFFFFPSATMASACRGKGGGLNCSGILLPSFAPRFPFLNLSLEAYSVAWSHTPSAGWPERKASGSETRDGSFYLRGDVYAATCRCWEKS